ncbi:MAG TPA: M56 family metallopeptidase [Bryobacteraceae bacterium]
MILPYPLRLLCLCLAAFFVFHLVLGLAAMLAAPLAIRRAERIRSQTAARLLLYLRLLPLAGSVFLVAGVCVPSYLWFEPEGDGEQIGAWCLAAAFLAVTIWAISIARGLRATVRSFRYVDRCRRYSRKMHLGGEPVPVWVVEGAPGCLVLAGIFRPRVFVSRAVLDALSVPQLSAALRHERAHRISRDNLKRLFLLLTPDVLPFSRCFRAIEGGWAKFAEWAADDGAVAGDSRRSLSLAAALVRVARLNPASPLPIPLVTSLLGGGMDLLVRVDRLLREAPPREAPPRGTPVLAAGAIAGALALAVAGMLQPATLHAAHRLLEELMH